jgi:hypothetical protein
MRNGVRKHRIDPRLKQTTVSRTLSMAQEKRRCESTLEKGIKYSALLRLNALYEIPTAHSFKCTTNGAQGTFLAGKGGRKYIQSCNRDRWGVREDLPTSGCLRPQDSRLSWSQKPRFPLTARFAGEIRRRECSVVALIGGLGA